MFNLILNYPVCKTGVDQITRLGNYKWVPGGRGANSILWVGPEHLLAISLQKLGRGSVQEETALGPEDRDKSLAGSDRIKGMRLCLVFPWVWGLQTWVLTLGND